MRDRIMARQAIVTAGLPAVVGAAAFAAAGPTGLILALLAAVPWLGWRLNDAAGTWLMLSVMFLVVLIVPMLLLALLAGMGR